MSKLNLQWVSDSIGDDYKNWNKGDTVLMEAQTGTGKSWFIQNVLLDEMMDQERLLLVCNRTHLKRQLKKDLLEKYKQPIPSTLEELDKITTIADKVTITSYHAISHTIQDSIYEKTTKKYNVGHYDYIVMDECHFLFADGSFNNKTRFAYKELVQEYYPHSIKIFISATMFEVRQPIINAVNKIKNNGFGLDEAEIHEYSTGTDYSYLSPKYFKSIETIVNVIKNDTSEEKWLIFISDIERDGKKIMDEFGEKNCSLIKSGTVSDELKSIIDDSKFNKKILICTKALDNGINIRDSKLKNIVIMTWDRITFIQMLGRKRININDAEQVNLYIPTRYKKSFLSKLKVFKEKERELELHHKNPSEFYNKYDNDLKDFQFVNDLFYRNVVTGKIDVNLIGMKRLYADIQFAEKMIEKFEADKKYAFIKEQLSWLGIEDNDIESNMLEDVVLEEDIEKLEDYLNSIINKKLFSDDQQKLSDLVVRELITISSKTDYRTKKINPTTLETIIRDQLNLPYAISKPKQETKGEMRKKRYIVISKIN
ncbi:DEAD/DEAH box helicase [Sutcliffiella cohnii]|uniref:DEAD/DEAH box helicase n=1 Tax=Sutcliffiella cohnii TaxID=33932 RepID=UPI002E1C83A6|nr:DEAD/DEAH box helicase family protein [Sutcliffiella cohnii]MED4016977.1 DEAD/DEAH box helicase family protein [Sutcliffiella cohnii]